MKHIVPAFRIFVFMTVITGIIYPLIGTAISQLVFSLSANGSLIKVNGQIMGSELVAQKFESSKYFWARPSAGDYNPLPSGGSNLGQISADLKKVVDERAARLKAIHPDKGEPPQDLLFASASGIDPEISPEAAQYQIERVALARGYDGTQKERLAELVKAHVVGRDLGVLGEPRVNVLKLNMALDKM